jgi:type 1 glutamine amidotransferase
MTPRFIFRLCTAIALAIVASASLANAKPAVKKVLFFSKSSGYEHAVIKRHGDEPSFVEKLLAAEGPKHGLAFTFTKDGSLFTPKYLAQFDAFCFFTSGDLLAPGKDGNPPMTLAGRAALFDAVAHGKGFVGIHAAADTFHTGETPETDVDAARIVRHRILGERADPYTRMLGAEHIMHGKIQAAPARVIDPKFPGFASLGESFTWTEEWYSMTDFSHDLHVLLVLDTEKMTGLPYQRPPYPVSWAHMQGKGRAFFTALGHGEQTWNNPLFQDMLFGGLSWAVRNTKADVTPNIEQVAPQAWKLPPAPIPPKPAAKKTADDAKKPE